MSRAPGLVREVGLVGLTAIAINGVVGSGIFVLPATVAGLMGETSPVAYLVARRVLALPDGGPLRQAALLLVFACGAFETANAPTEEAKTPRRDLPIALVFAIAATALLYVLIQIVALGTVPTLAFEKAPLAAVGRALMGEAGARLVTLCAVGSTSGSLSAIVVVRPRILHAFAP